MTLETTLNVHALITSSRIQMFIFSLLLARRDLVWGSFFS